MVCQMIIEKFGMFLWNKIFGKPYHRVNPKHDRQRRCKKVSTRVHCDRYNEVKDIRDRLENE